MNIGRCGFVAAGKAIKRTEATAWGWAEHEATLPWTTAIRASVDARYCAPNFERVAQDASRWETPNFTRASAQAFSIPAFSMEVPYGRCGDLVLTVEEYREVGARIARGMAGVLAAG